MFIMLFLSVYIHSQPSSCSRLHWNGCCFYVLCMYNTVCRKVHTTHTDAYIRTTHPWTQLGISENTELHLRISAGVYTHYTFH